MRHATPCAMTPCVIRCSDIMGQGVPSPCKSITVPTSLCGLVALLVVACDASTAPLDASPAQPALDRGTPDATLDADAAAHHDAAAGEDGTFGDNLYYDCQGPGDTCNFDDDCDIGQVCSSYDDSLRPTDVRSCRDVRLCGI